MGDILSAPAFWLLGLITSAFGFYQWKYCCRPRRVLRALRGRRWKLQGEERIRCGRYLIVVGQLRLDVYRRTIICDEPAFVVLFRRDPAVSPLVRWLRPTASGLLLHARRRLQRLTTGV